MINCLTYEQLQAYSAYKVKKAEREHLYMHISSCELCACAVNGFTAHPFVSDELVAIHREIDTRTNATVMHPLTTAQFFIVTLSLLSILGVYALADHPLKENRHTAIAAKPEVPVSKPIIHETQTSSKEEISSVTKTVKKIVNVIQFQEFDRKITPVEKLEMIDPIGTGSVAKAQTREEMTIAPHFNSNVIYIYDLKVSDYNKLYFGVPVVDNLANIHTPPSKENEHSLPPELGSEKYSIAANRVLKDGLAAFNKQQFSAAVENFNLLLENNPKDVNAQFYSALAFYNLNKIEMAKSRLAMVLVNSNDAFFPEAQWYQALFTLKSGEREKAKQLFEVIVSEKGFYSKRAKEKLKKL